MKLFRKPKSKFYWYDFTVRSRRSGGSFARPRAQKPGCIVAANNNPQGLQQQINRAGGPPFAVFKGWEVGAVSCASRNPSI